MVGLATPSVILVVASSLILADFRAKRNQLSEIMAGKVANPNGVFFAFASKPVETHQVIEQAITEYRCSGGILDLKPWTEMKVSGGLIWKKIFEEIDHRPFFIADITSLNSNVTMR
jgi:hypothetical protein